MNYLLQSSDYIALYNQTQDIAVDDLKVTSLRGYTGASVTLRGPVAMTGAVTIGSAGATGSSLTLNGYTGSFQAVAGQLSATSTAYTMPNGPGAKATLPIFSTVAAGFGMSGATGTTQLICNQPGVYQTTFQSGLSCATGVTAVLSLYQNAVQVGPNISVNTGSTTDTAYVASTSITNLAQGDTLSLQGYGSAALSVTFGAPKLTAVRIGV